MPSARRAIQRPAGRPKTTQREPRAGGIYVAWERIGTEPDGSGRLMNVPAQPRYVTVGFTGTRRRAGRYRYAIRNVNDALLGGVAFDLEE